MSISCHWKKCLFDVDWLVGCQSVGRTTLTAVTLARFVRHIPSNTFRLKELVNEERENDEPLENEIRTKERRDQFLIILYYVALQFAVKIGTFLSNHCSPMKSRTTIQTIR